MNDKNAHISLEEDIAVHIFSVSATMVGVCLTVVGIIHGLIKNTENFADDILSFASVVFLLSCGLSYGALRKRHSRRLPGLERAADALFMTGMIMVSAAAFMITYFFV